MESRRGLAVAAVVALAAVDVVLVGYALDAERVRSLVGPESGVTTQQRAPATPLPLGTGAPSTGPGDPAPPGP